MAMTEGESERMIVCNGFKDDSYIEAVILATKLGRTIIPVVENFGELQLILKHAEHYEVRPRIGVRVKLATEGAGRWRESSGEKSKFGLFVTEILELFRTLKERGMEDCLQLVHCHPGSQLQDIRRVKDAVNELAHVYAELKLMGAGLKYIDIGGGLGVDYDGSRTNYASSMNYTLAEYASDVVYRIANVCNARGIEHPVIVSESGRAITAHHSVLVFNTLGGSRLDKFRVTDDDRAGLAAPASVCRRRCATFSTRTSRSRSAGSSSASTTRCRPASRRCRCSTSAISVSNRAASSSGCTGRPAHGSAISRASFPRCRRSSRVSRRCSATSISATSRCSSRCRTAGRSTSSSRSCRSIGSRSGRSATAVLADITCDSDGKIDHFVSQRDIKRTLELHELVDGENYYLAAFLVGAYQETLGDLHNLFGDTHVVHIKLHDEGGWWIEETVKGDTAAEVLRYMRYDVERLFPQLARDCERAVREGRLSLTESQALQAVLRVGAERLYVSRAGLTPVHCRRRRLRGSIDGAAAWNSRRLQRSSVRSSSPSSATRHSSRPCCLRRRARPARWPCSPPPRSRS